MENEEIIQDEMEALFYNFKDYEQLQEQIQSENRQMTDEEIELDEEEKSNTINEQDSNNEENPLERFQYIGKKIKNFATGIEAMDIKNALELTRAKGQQLSNNDTSLSNNLPNVEKAQEEHEQTSSISSSVNRQKTADDEQTKEQEKTVPDFSMVANGKFQSFTNMSIKNYNKDDNTYTLSNGENSVTVTKDVFDEISKPLEKNNETNQAIYDNMIKSQYDYYFETQENTANNFKHNFAVYCRREANSPVDALAVAKGLIAKMSKEEEKKLKLLLKQMETEDKSINQIVVGMYHEAVKEFPLNESIVKTRYPSDVRKRLTSDVVNDNGEPINDDPKLIKGDDNRNPKIGQTINNLVMNVDSVITNKKELMTFDALTIVSSSKEHNKITLMDKNNSYFDVNREKFLESYNKRIEKELKQEHKEAKKSHRERIRNSISIER